MALPMRSVLTEETEVVKDCDDINDFHGCERTFLIIETDDQDLIIVGCRTLHDIAYYSVVDQLLGSYESAIEEWLLIKGEILNPSDLPYDHDYGSVYVLYRDEILLKCDTMKEATRCIEDAFRQGWGYDITDFAIISGVEIRMEMKLRLKGMIENFRLLLTEGELENNGRQ